jgi:outer membrane protein OmpA-like peptidoglycan-associated protein
LIKYLVSIFIFLSYHKNCIGQLVIDKYDNVELTAFINKISIDDDNYIWVCTSNGISKIGDINTTPENILKGKNISSITHDKRLGTFASDGYQIFQLKNNKIFNLDNEGIIINDLEIFQGRMYAGTNKGLYIINVNTGRIEIQNERNSKLKSNHINFVHEDIKGVLWLGTKKGEVRIRDGKWKVYHDEFNVTDYYENKEGMWFIGDGEMWLVDYYNREYNAGLNAELYSGNLNDFVIDNDGKLYVASNKLVRYDPYQESTKEYSEDAGLLSKKCTSIACDKNNNIWIGTGGTGLYRLVFGEVAVAKFNATCLLESGISCYNTTDAKIKVSVSGGIAPYAYKWSKNSLKGDNPANVSPGTYTVYVTDNAGETVESKITIKAPEPITLDLESMTRISGPGRRDGALVVKAVGGTGTLKYNWSNGDRNPEAKRLQAGKYTLKVTDINSCEAEATFEVLKEKFIPELDITSLEVGKTLRINELKFTADSTDVSESSYEVLEEILGFLQENENVVVEIGGHTNTIPSHDYCDKLSAERARSVAEYFYANGISSKRLSYKGYGKRQPLTKDESLKGRQRNQRVEIKVLAI